MLDKSQAKWYNTIRKRKGDKKMITYEEMMKNVEELRKQGKEPHGVLREMLIEYQLNRKD